MAKNKVVSHQAWTKARVAFLKKEKAFNKLRDQLSADRRALPWEKVEQDYEFEGPRGKRQLAELFDGRSQLVVYHFMFDPTWTEGCKACSFWADNFERNVVHLAARDVTLVAVSRAPLATLEAYKKRMGWTFAWYSSLGSDFNFDHQVSSTAESVKTGRTVYNYAPSEMVGEHPGISVFTRDTRSVFHTYSTYARGLDMLNAGYHYLDLVPKGRDEAKLESTMEWLRRRDQY